MPRNFVCPQCQNNLLDKLNEYHCSHCNIFYPIINGIPSFVPSDYKDDSLSTDIFDLLDAVEKKHFWHRGRNAIIYQTIKSVIPKEKIWGTRFLEIGCGNGNILRYLKEKGMRALEGSELSEKGLARCKENLSTSHYSVPLYRVNALTTPFPSESYETIGLFDIIEHIDDDQRVLNEAYRMCEKNGFLFMTVPAHQSLWSPLDDAFGHKRRYDKKELVEKIKKAGFTVKKISYFIFFLFPILLISRKLSAHKKQSQKVPIRYSSEFKIVPVVNTIFYLLIKLESMLLKKINLPMGNSLICIAQKK
ncbi:MAG: methyltransferase domain-containing protein [Parcubacteria group bacterium]|nr:methyltransferase domain-containing protein [Parcubacteria group bacterium]